MGRFLLGHGFGEEGSTNGAHNDITRVTKLLHHAVGEMGTLHVM